MNPIKPGYYFIKMHGELFPAFWDGEKFIPCPSFHKNDQPENLDHEELLFNLIRCPTGCSCTQNGDGSWNVQC